MNSSELVEFVRQSVQYKAKKETCLNRALEKIRNASCTGAGSVNIGEDTVCLEHQGYVIGALERSGFQVDNAVSGIFLVKWWDENVEDLF